MLMVEIKQFLDKKNHESVMEGSVCIFAQKTTMEKHMKVIDAIAIVLILIGGLNWGLVGFFDIDIVSAIVGKESGISRLIFALVGLSALYKIFFWKHIHARWCK
jgi:uncharacterized membrane protein YuzA (DUF378 family)